MIEKSAIVASIVIFIWSTMLNGMIFGNFGNWIVNNFKSWVSKPICDCVVCMAPWYGTAAYWLIWGQSVKEWIIVVSVAAGFNSIFAVSNKLIKTE